MPSEPPFDWWGMWVNPRAGTCLGAGGDYPEDTVVLVLKG